MKNEAKARANGDEILKQIERGLLLAGIDGRVIDAIMEVERRSMPVRTAQMFGAVDYVDLGAKYTLTLKIDVTEVHVLDVPVVMSEWASAFEQPRRAIARAGEEV